MNCVSMTQVIIISDTFTQFATPLDEEAGMADDFLQFTGSGRRRRRLQDYRMRIENSKLIQQ